MREGSYTIVEAHRLEELAPQTLWGELCERGAVICRGLEPTNETMLAISTMFADDFISYPDNLARKNVIDSGTIQTVHTGKNGLLLHSELSYSPFRPDLIWFQCIVPPPGDTGRTLLADGAEVLANFSEGTRAELNNRWLCYSDELESDFWGMLFHTEDPSEAQSKFDSLGFEGLHFEGKLLKVDYRQPVIGTSRLSGQRVFCNNLHHDRFDHDHLHYEDGSLPRADVYDEIARRLEEASRWIPWQTGDIAIVDNTRMLHGRTAVGDTKRQIHSRFGWASERVKAKLDASQIDAVPALPSV